ncbi:MAG: DNA repair protein RecN [Muribaculaceae bacterium]|jgi:DNA repair protein RecN (Recombination protein N)|nr:DNA repair protein RecN [Muribaculaceae bacterium]
MLSQLSISNYALIDHLEISFKQGLTIMTGETGAGKSIIIGALSLILGERADLKVIRDTEKKSVIEAVFDISDYGFEKFFSDNDLEYDVKECILRREITSSGRSRAFINDSPVTLPVLRSLSIRLIDIHSQHSNLLLADAGYQLSIIDSIAHNDALLAQYSTAFAEYRTAQSRLSAARANLAKAKKDEEYIRFQLEQFKKLALKSGEDKELETEQSKLENTTEIKNSLWNSLTLLNENEDSIIVKLSAVRQHLSQIRDVFPDVAELSDRVSSSAIELKDIAESLTALQESVISNPDRLELVEQRLNAIYDLETKHNVASADELIEIQHGFESKLSEIDNSDDELHALEDKLKQSEAEARRIADMLSTRRKTSGEAFIKELKEMAVPLGMKNLQFNIDFSQIPLDEVGSDAVIFLFSFNKQQPLMPVQNTASGGEISRLMLCIKAIIAKNMQLPTIIFDEIDTGVSGDIANRMGELMAGISKNIQVITITHLPQVAVKGDNHFKVFKTDSGNSTFTGIKELSLEERVSEVAYMLSGQRVDEAAINNARSLLGIK